MTKEEQEAIMYLKQCVIRKIPIPEEGISWLIIALNLIDKQQKEIEELKNMIKVVNIAREDIPNETDFIVLTKKSFEKNYNYISKDKIRERIDELYVLHKSYLKIPDISGAILLEGIIKMMEELLEE